MDQNHSRNEDNRTVCENIPVSAAEAKHDNLTEEELKCFVCDARIQGRHYALATCKTQSTRSKVIDKLGELVGERYLVVISEDDVICRSCANLINTLDKLESEILHVRMNVLRFLEQKYSLQEGEFLENSKNTKRSQPPQITKSNSQNSQTKKRNSAYISSLLESNAKKKLSLRMQCNKCRYTTSYYSFGAYHAKSSNVHYQYTRKQRNNSEKEEISVKTCNENVPHTSLIQSNTVEENVPLMPLQTFVETRMPCNDENVSETKANSVSAVLPSENDPNTDQSPYMRVLQPLGINEETTTDPTMLIASTSDPGLIMKLKDNAAKQILTLTEDGDLEMMEVTWNDVNPLEPESKLTF